MRQLDEVKAELEKLITWRGAIEDANLSLELYDLDPDEEMLSEAHHGLEKLKQELERWETERLLSGTYDKEGAVLSINAELVELMPKTGPKCFLGCIPAGLKIMV